MEDKLLEWNRQGLIPGPDETLSDFEKRVHYCLGLKETLGQQLSLPEKIDNPLATQLMHEVAPITDKLFDMTPAWAPIIFSNEKLAPWHGGCAWIYQLTDETPTGAFFQLRKAFASKTRFLGLYDRKELIAHESAHVGRMMFQEPKFEEFLAYRTGSRFRQWFGPIIQSPWESIIFLLVLFFTVTIELGALVWGSPELYYSVTWMKILPLLLIGGGLLRLWLRHRQFNHCLKKLQMTLNDDHKANAVIYRLQDIEIAAFGKMNSEEVRKYATLQTDESLRWQVIANAYF